MSSDSSYIVLNFSVYKTFCQHASLIFSSRFTVFLSRSAFLSSRFPFPPSRFPFPSSRFPFPSSRFTSQLTTPFLRHSYARQPVISQNSKDRTEGPTAGNLSISPIVAHVIHVIHAIRVAGYEEKMERTLFSPGFFQKSIFGEYQI